MVVPNTFYLPFESLLLGTKCMFKQQHLQIFGLTLNKYYLLYPLEVVGRGFTTYFLFYPLEVVGRGSETQIQVG